MAGDAIERRRQGAFKEGEETTGQSSENECENRRDGAYGQEQTAGSSNECMAHVDVRVDISGPGGNSDE